MIETYAFFAMFMVQILTMSVLHPARLIKYCRLKVAEFPPERFPQLHSAGVFGNLSTEHMLYLGQDPNVGTKDSLIGIDAVTLSYALSAFTVYKMVYDKKLNPLDTHAGNVHMIGLAVKSAAYACIVCVVFLSLIFTLEALALQSWKPFAVSAFLVFSGLMCLTAFVVPPRKPQSDEPGASSEVPS